MFSRGTALGRPPDEINEKEENTATVSTVASLNSRTDLQFLSDSQDCASIRFDFGPKWEGFEYDSYFVRAEDGEYKEIWGMCGMVPYMSKLVTRLV